MSTTITFNRSKAFAFSLRRIAILVDGKKSGKIGPNKRISISVEPGHHVIQARLDYLIRGWPIHINATGGEMEIVVRVPDSYFGFWRERNLLKLEVIQASGMGPSDP